MTYLKAFSLIYTDYLRYKKYKGLGGVIRTLVYERGFVYTIWLRLAAVNGLFFPICWLIYHYLSSLYCVQIPRKLKIGKGLYLGHGCCICINSSAEIGDYCDIFQMTTIGSWKGHAAVIGNHVKIGPNVNLVENVHIGNNSVIGAGSVVLQDVPANCVVAGVPAKIIKRYNHKTKQWVRVSENNK